MPYKRNFKKRTYRGRGRKPYVNRTKKLVTGQGPTWLETVASGVGSVASLARAVAPAIAAINTEHKYFDVSGGLSPTLASPSIQPLCLVAQGLTDKTRIGNSMLAKSIQVRIRLVLQNEISGTYGSPYSSIRVMLIVDKLQGGTAPTIAQIMENTSNNISMANKNYTDRFTVIKDKMCNFSPNWGTGSTTPTQAVCDFKFFKPLDFHIRYLGTDATAASAGPNQLYLICWPAHSVGCSFTFYTRLNFTDN